MIGPDDPRHGTTRGYHQHCDCRPCADAMALYERRRRKTTQLYGHGYSKPAQGSRRRIEALMALGYTAQQIATECGWQNGNAVHAIRKRKWVEVPTHQTVLQTYERLCMVIPEGPHANRQRILAAKKGWVVPLAWDDIDNDPEPPTDRATDEPDHAAIQRVLDGDTTIKPTPTELKHIITTLHARGLTDAQIAARTNTKHNTIQATRQRLGLELNPANLNWAEFGIKPRVRPYRNKKAAA